MAKPATCKNRRMFYMFGDPRKVAGMPIIKMSKLYSIGAKPACINVYNEWLRSVNKDSLQVSIKMQHLLIPLCSCSFGKVVPPLFTFRSKPPFGAN
jgi:hypothetical protein